jgi:hypothetical protein
VSRNNRQKRKRDAPDRDTSDSRETEPSILQRQPTRGSFVSGSEHADVTDGRSARDQGGPRDHSESVRSETVRSEADEEPTLTVGESDSAFEREAQKVAAQVTSGLTSGVGSAGTGTPRVQRSTSDASTGAVGGREAPASVHDVLSSPGQSPDTDVVRRMGEKMNEDFSSVSVHTGPRAAESARDVNARAYTVGDDIVFDSGEYAPDTPGGRRVLAHELTHVAQQSEGDAVVQRKVTSKNKQDFDLDGKVSRGEIAELAELMSGEEISDTVANDIIRGLNEKQKWDLLTMAHVERPSKSGGGTNAFEVLYRKILKGIGGMSHNSSLKNLARKLKTNTVGTGDTIVREKGREVGQKAVTEYHSRDMSGSGGFEAELDLLNHLNDLDDRVQKQGEKEGEAYGWEVLGGLVSETIDEIQTGELNELIRSFTEGTEASRKSSIQTVADRLKPSYDERQKRLDDQFTPENEGQVAGRAVDAVVRNGGQAFDTVGRMFGDVPTGTEESVSASLAIRPDPEVPVAIRLNGSFEVEHDEDDTWSVEAELGIGGAFDVSVASVGAMGEKHVSGEGSTLDRAMLGLSYAAYREFLGDDSQQYGLRAVKAILSLGTSELTPSVGDLIWGGGQKKGSGSYKLRAQRWAAAAESVLLRDQQELYNKNPNTEKKSGGAHGGSLEAFGAAGISTPDKKVARGTGELHARWITSKAETTETFVPELAGDVDGSGRGENFAGNLVTDENAALKRRQMMRDHHRGSERAQAFELGGSVSGQLGGGSYGIGGGIGINYRYDHSSDKHSLKLTASVSGAALTAADNVRKMVEELLNAGQKAEQTATDYLSHSVPAMTQSAQSELLGGTNAAVGSNPDLPGGQPTGQAGDLAAGVTQTVGIDSGTSYKATVIINGKDDIKFILSSTESVGISGETGYVGFDVTKERSRAVYTYPRK